MQHLVYSTVAEAGKQDPITITSCQDPDLFCRQTQGKLHNWGLFPKNFIAQRHNSLFLNYIHKNFSPFKIPLLPSKFTSPESSLQCYLSIHKFSSSFRYFLAWQSTCEVVQLELHPNSQELSTSHAGTRLVACHSLWAFSYLRLWLREKENQCLLSILDNQSHMLFLPAGNTPSVSLLVMEVIDVSSVQDFLLMLEKGRTSLTSKCLLLLLLFYLQHRQAVIIHVYSWLQMKGKCLIFSTADVLCWRHLLYLMDEFLLWRHYQFSVNLSKILPNFAEITCTVPENLTAHFCSASSLLSLLQEIQETHGFCGNWLDWTMPSDSYALRHFFTIRYCLRAVLVPLLDQIQTLLSGVQSSGRSRRRVLSAASCMLSTCMELNEVNQHPMWLFC